MRSDALSLSAWKYAAGELGPVDAAAFELKLSEDQDARDALEEAVRLSAAALGQAAPTPDPLYRGAVVESLRPFSWVRSLFARRPYRGHPVTWTTAGAATTACAGVALWLSLPPSALPNVAPPSFPSSADSVVVVMPPPASAPVTGSSIELPRNPSTVGPMGETVGVNLSEPQPSMLDERGNVVHDG